MGARLRKMKPYHPRRRSKGINSNKQALHDLKHKLSADVGSFIVLLKQGNEVQIVQAQQKAKSDFLKHSMDMQKIAQQMGEKYVKVVREYLDSIDELVHTTSLWMDESKIHHCFQMSEKFDKEISAA